MKSSRAKMLNEMAPELERRALELVKGKRVPFDPSDPDVQLASYYAKLAAWAGSRKTEIKEED